MLRLVSLLMPMNRSATVRRLVVFVFVLLGSAQLASPAHAAAVVLRASASHTDVFPVEGYPCLPQAVGTGTQTESSTFQFVDTGGRVFTMHGVDVFDLRIDFADGSHLQSSINRDLVSGAFNPPLTVINVVGQEVDTLYNAQGRPAGTIEIHAGSHITFTDLNGNGQPDAGEISVAFDRFRLRCP